MASSKNIIYFYVDGKCEKAIKDKIDQSLITPIFVQRTKNGRDVSLDAIAKECSNLLNSYASLGQGHIFLIDKEKRTNYTPIFMETHLEQSIKKQNSNSFDLVVTDIMFENWILADIENVSHKNNNLLKQTNNNSNFEGKNGSAVLDDLWISKTTKYSSDKITHSKKLFKHVRPDIGSTYSQSFKKFMSIINKYNIKLF